jgi:putative membrane protein
MVSQAQANPADWPVDVGAAAHLPLVGLLVFLGLWSALVLRAVVLRKRTQVAHALGSEELTAVHAALVAAERRTIGEILPVVLERSDRHEDAAWRAALSVLATGSLLLLPWLPWHAPLALLALQAAMAGVGYASARTLPEFLRPFLVEARARERVEEQAFLEFHRYGLASTEARTGVLLFVSLLERRAVVLADVGVDARITPGQWEATNAAVLAGLARGSLRDGLLAGIENAGRVLAEHFPVAANDRNEVPDRVIVRRE